MGAPFTVATTSPAGVWAAASNGRLSANSAARYIVIGGLAPDFHVHAHRAGGTLYLVHGRLQIEAIEVGHFDLGNFLDLFERDLADAVLVRLGGTFGDRHGALDQHRHRRRLGNEGEGAVGVNG